jgi:hypothetical protein
MTINVLKTNKGNLLQKVVKSNQSYDYSPVLYKSKYLYLERVLIVLSKTWDMHNVGLSTYIRVIFLDTLSYFYADILC